MSNSYYVITLPADKNKDRFNAFKLLGVKKGNARDLLHFRWNNDQTKVLVQGEILSKLLDHTKGKSYIQYLGECLPSGQAEQSVYDYLEANKKEWEVEDLEVSIDRK